MGNENSTLIDEDTPTQTLKDRSLRAVADHIRNGGARRIVVLTGAGISTAAGSKLRNALSSLLPCASRDPISWSLHKRYRRQLTHHVFAVPDFRSPKTGLYHNLARLKLPHAEAVFDIDYFRENPYPFYMLAKELYPGRFHPTISHAFIGLLAKRGKLRMLFTQNIDCLERRAGVPDHLIVEAHGSFATQRCIDCKTEFPGDEMPAYVDKGEPPRCKEAKCRGLVKPDIVFFGEQLPSAFFDNRHVPEESDLVLILGTSLSVHPFASLPDMALETTPRVLFNKERVGTLGHRADDVICLGDCDSGVRKLADELGWRDELDRLWRGMVGDEEADRQLQQVNQEREKDGENWEPAWNNDEIERLVQGVADKLDISGNTADEDRTANDEGQDGITKEQQAPAVAAAAAKGGADGAEDDVEKDRKEEVTRPAAGEADLLPKDTFGDRTDAAEVAGTATTPARPSDTPQEIESLKGEGHAAKHAASTPVDTSSEKPAEPIASHVMKT
ncbi:sir2 family domain-containing protein [Apiospora kogelbergensis]|uniref:Sir2 family domain-containing protein n=1 Tax=Apiospora kogelbergensis TaxID=1337665 RepID=A0AAW0RBH2_9PEZI